MRSISIVLVIALFTAYVPVPAFSQDSWVTIVSPTSGESISGDRAEVSISYSTGSSDLVTHIEIDVDGAQYGVKHLAEPNTRGIASFLVDTTRFGNGSHKFIVKVFSGSKLVGSTSGTCTIGNRPVDALGPEIKFVGIKKGQVISGIAQFEIAAKDNGKRTPMVSVFIDDTLRLIKNTPPYEYEWDTRSYPDGKHVLAAYAYDEAGNKSEAESVDVVIRNGNKAVLASEPKQVKEEPKQEPAVQVATTITETTQPVIPVEIASRVDAARSVEPKVTTTTEPKGPVAKSDRVVTQVVEPEPVVIAKAVETAPAVKDIRTPNVTTTDVSEEPMTNVISDVPSDVTAPVATEQPTSAESALTIENQRAVVESPELETELARTGMSQQKLVRPEIPVNQEEAQPVRMALAPKLVPAVQPSVEAYKTKIKLNSTKRKGVVVAELRNVIESAGGQIIAWDKRTKTAVATIDNKKIKIKIGSKTAIVNGEEVKLTGTPYINSSGRTVVDTKILKSLLGTRLHVDEQTGKCTLVVA